MSEMKIDVDWLPPFQGPEEVGRTSAAIRLLFGYGETPEWNATRFEDAFSQSVQQAARVSAWPLALWIASSWWRIRWEPRPTRIRLLPGMIPSDNSWRMSHELSAAGYGFIWPRLTLAGDGEEIAAQCRPSPLSDEPVRYLSEFDALIPAREFERATDGFLDLVLRRLDSLGRTELHILWEEVLAERADPLQAAARKIEALLGYDPDEAPEALLNRLLELKSEAGVDAVDEIAPACAGSSPAESLKDVLCLATAPGIPGRIAIPGEAPVVDGALPPWQRARQLATHLRQALGSGNQPLDDEVLGDLLQIPSGRLAEAPIALSKAPLGLAVGDQFGNQKFLFRKRNRPARRFEAARFVADSLCAARPAGWHPVTDSFTARQKLQRAFAAEFLCPIEGLKEYLGAEFLPEAFEDAADTFGISELAIKSHLANHHLIPRMMVESPVF